MLHWDRRLVMGGDFQPSERLILDAVRRRESVLHVWNAADTADRRRRSRVSQGVDWAFCTPVGGKACQGWGIYVAGRFSDDRTDARRCLGPQRPARRFEIHRAGRHDARRAARRADARAAAGRAEPVLFAGRARSLARRRSRKWCWRRARPKSRCCSATCAASRGIRNARPKICWDC